MEAMPTAIDRDAVQRLMADEAAQLVEVLPAKEFGEEHLPGAINIPLKSMNRDSVAALDRSRPTVVYCWVDI